MKTLHHYRTASKDGRAVHIEDMIIALRQQGHEASIQELSMAWKRSATRAAELGASLPAKSWQPAPQRKAA